MGEGCVSLQIAEKQKERRERGGRGGKVANFLRSSHFPWLERKEKGGKNISEEEKEGGVAVAVKKIIGDIVGFFFSKLFSRNGPEKRGEGKERGREEEEISDRFRRMREGEKFAQPEFTLVQRQLLNAVVSAFRLPFTQIVRHDKVM